MQNVVVPLADSEYAAVVAIAKSEGHTPVTFFQHIARKLVPDIPVVQPDMPLVEDEEPFDEANDPILKWSGFATADITDLAHNHDKYLLEDYTRGMSKEFVNAL